MIPLAFANIGMLAALIALPAIWFFLRLTPPKPRLEDFPPMRLLLRIARKEEQPARSPWWLTALRLTIAAMVILALAGPVYNPVEEQAPGSGPLMIVVDNSWAAAARWDVMVDSAKRMAGLAAEADRPVALLAAADGSAQVIAPADPSTVAERLEALLPRPWAADYAGLARRLGQARELIEFGGAIWLSSGIDQEGIETFGAALESSVDGPIVTYLNDAADIVALAPPVSGADALNVPVIRTESADGAAGIVRARDIKGRIVGEAPFAIDGGETLATASFTIPVELRNEIVRLEIAGTSSAGAVQLIDDRWRRRRIGLLSGASADTAQPLLSPLYYISRAAQPFAEIREARDANAAVALADLIDTGASVIAMADIGTLPPDVVDTVADWVRAGGTLVRFAGPRLAADTDELIPVTLRNGDRILGGSLSWRTPQPLGSFSDNGPFAGLPMPDDVFVSRQVLAEPDGSLAERTWAALADGTPLVTAATVGKGRLVLFHVTADTSWSNLPLSGAFVEMLRRIVAFSTNLGASDTAGEEAQPVPPYRLLDGFGRFEAPGSQARPIVGGLADISVDADHPPGLYGSEEGFRALNLIASQGPIDRVDRTAFAGIDFRPYPVETPIGLAPWLLVVALVLLAADTLAVLWLNGGLRLRLGKGATAATLALAMVLAALASPPGANADEVADQMALLAANTTRMAYVVTGDSQVDEISRAGLDGLSRVIADRTALEPGDPIGVDPARDELAFFPLIYWPVTPDTALPPANVMARIGAYMRQGGSVLFDTRDQFQRSTSIGSLAGTPAMERLRDMLASLDIPPLEPVPADHVLTKAFYLLNDFPGRYAGGPLWVEVLEGEGRADRPARAGDGVSTILITSNDFAGAWAADEGGTFLLPTVPPDRIQREMSLRAGTNIVMYALTGNYKADQVHVPALLERLGQ